MSSSRRLSQQEIDAVFAKLQGVERSSATHAVPFDFRRPDRISKAQLRSIHVLHDNFVRNLVSSLSAFLRSYLVINLICVEQLSYGEFIDGLPSPTVLVALGLKPYEGNAVLEINQSLVFPILEILLGGSGKSNVEIKREISDIEKNVLDGLIRLILRDLREAWKSGAGISFTTEALENEPQFLQIRAPSEAVVAIAIEVRIGDVVGMMNLAMPSILMKMMRSQFDQQWSVRRSETTDKERNRMMRLLQPAKMNFDARLEGPTLLVEDLLGLEEGQVLAFDFPVRKELDLWVNNMLRYRGQIVATENNKRGFAVGRLDNGKEEDHDVPAKK